MPLASSAPRRSAGADHDGLGEIDRGAVVGEADDRLHDDEDERDRRERDVLAAPLLQAAPAVRLEATIAAGRLLACSTA